MGHFCARKATTDAPPIKHFLSPTEAAAMLAANLGGTSDEWLIFLRDDRHPGIEDADREIPFDEHDGEFWYCDMDLLLFILSRKPPDLAGATVISLDDTPFWCDAHGDIDIMRSCQLMVHVRTPKRFTGRSWLTATQARELGRSLIELADWCDTHRYDPVKKHVYRITETSSINELEGGE